MTSMTIGRKIALTAIVLVAFTIVLAAASLVSIAGLSAEIHQLQVDSIPGLYASNRIGAWGKGLGGFNECELVEPAATSGQNNAQVEKDLAQAQAKFQEEMTAYEKTITLAEDRQM